MQENSDTVYTTEEVAERLKVAPKTVREWIRRGELEAWDAGQGYRILKRDLDAFIEKKKQQQKKRGKSSNGTSDN
jgi:excisionase family DNA binding protein